jgi:hypothetical protein
MSVIPTDVQRAREQTAHRARWHDRHAQHVDPPAARPPETPPTPTRTIRLKLWAERHLLLVRKRGLLRHLSWQWWTVVLKVFRWAWRVFLWVRGAYKYVRWRLSRRDTPEGRHAKNATCSACEWLKRVDGGLYCDACICPKKPRADVRRKNTRTYPHCQKGKHPGSKVDAYAKLAPCVGCGSKRNGNATLAR